MGVPYIQAPCEAESQCAQLVKAKLVDAVGTEDMDALTFGSTLLLRHLTFSEARKMPIKEFHLCMYSFITCKDFIHFGVGRWRAKAPPGLASVRLMFPSVSGS